MHGSKNGVKGKGGLESWGFVDIVKTGAVGECRASFFVSASVQEKGSRGRKIIRLSVAAGGGKMTVNHPPLTAASNAFVAGPTFAVE